MLFNWHLAKYAFILQFVMSEPNEEDRREDLWNLPIPSSPPPFLCVYTCVCLKSLKQGITDTLIEYTYMCFPFQACYSPGGVFPLLSSFKWISSFI